jgi:hypothetical protein
MGAMSGIHRFYVLGLCPDSLTDDFAEAIAAITHGQKREDVVVAALVPAFGQGSGNLLSSEAAFKFVGGDQYTQGHGRQLTRGFDLTPSVNLVKLIKAAS